MKINLGQLIVLVVILVAIGAGGFYFKDRLKNSNSSNTKTRQAVFLTNGQVYFGYTTGESGKTVTLSDVYYLQVQQPLQPPKDDEQKSPQVSLVKLGNELHGPQDKMRINREHILFVEDMKDESKVNEAIRNYIKNGPTTQATPTPKST